MDLDATRLERAFETARGYIHVGRLACALFAVSDSKETLAIRSYGVTGEEAPGLQDRIYALASISKCITGAAVARLVDAGRLDYDDPVCKHIPEFGHTEARRKVTVGHIFTHRTGLPTLSVAAILEAVEDPDESYKILLDCDLDHEPGEFARYNTGSYQLINEIVRRLTGKRMSEFFAEDLFAAAGMKDTGFRPADPARAMPVLDYPLVAEADNEKWGRIETTGSGLWSTAADLLNLGRALLNGALLSETAFRRMTEPHSRPIFQGEGVTVRTLGWNRDPCSTFPNSPETGFYHGGATGTLLWLDPAADLVAVFLTNRWCSSNDHGFATLNCLYE